MRKLALVALLLAFPATAQQKSGKTSATWWGHAAWIVKSPGGATIAIDPWLKNPLAPKDAVWPEQVDAILVTHGHFDHVGETAELARRTGAQVIGAYELVGLIGAEKGNGANAGGTVQVKDVRIHLVSAVHSSGFGTDPKAPPQYGGSPLGFVLEFQGGPTLYHAGDTDVFQDMALIAERYRPTVAMLPIGGHFTMDPQGAALAARLLRVKTVVPMHFGTFPVLAGTPDQLSAALKKSGATATMLAFKPGETKEL
jgi:L-ascorbate metabolism protein UlaG (beta-lactamase superfamily)